MTRNISWLLGLMLIVSRLNSVAFGDVDLKPIIKRLEKLSQLAEAGEQNTKKLDFRIEGNFSYVPTGHKVPSSEKPEAFVYATKSGKHRFETELHVNETTTRFYRIDDGKQLIRVGGHQYTISQSAIRRNLWSHSTPWIGTLSNPIYSGEAMGVSARLRWYAEALKDKEIRPVYLSGKRTLSIHETNDEVVIHDSDSPGVKFSQAVFELVLDKTHSYRARQWITRDGQGSEEFSSAVTYTPRYHDVSSDSFFIVGGIIKFEEQGTLIAGTERDGTLTVHVEPTLIESGTFNCPKDYFSIDSLNIPKGTVISDSRVEPAVTFRYGESPLGDK